MLSQTLLDSEDDIDYLKYWEKTIMYKFFRKKQPSERWCKQLRRILDSGNKNKQFIFFKYMIIIYYIVMVGGLLQLKEKGAQDLYLTGQPQITFFKTIYRRYTNFSIE